MGAIWSTAAHLWRTMKEEYDAALQAAYDRAETDTNGVLVNDEGKRLGVHGIDLFTGREDRALRLASEELLEHWTRHPRMTLTGFEEQWMAGRMIWTD